MKNCKKYIILLAGFIVAVCIAYAVYGIVRNHQTRRMNPIRPKDFPDILVAPENATSLDHHSTPSNSVRAPHSYGISFLLNDPYPSENTRNFIRKNLESNGWRQLRYHLMNPDVPAKYHNPMVYQIYRDSNHLDKYDDDKKNNYWGWMQDWVNDKNENIYIIMYYKPINDKRLDPNNLYVNMTLFMQKSWVPPYIARYKQLHPEEFVDVNDNN